MELENFVELVEKWAEDNYDYSLNTENVDIRGESLLIPREVPLDSWAYGQYVKLIDGPDIRWIRRAREKHPEIVDNLIHDLNWATSKQFILRTRNDKGRAILSDSYSVFDHKDFVHIIHSIIGKSNFKNEITIVRNLIDNEMYAYLLFPGITVSHDPRGNTPLHPGIYIANSEVGRRSVVALPLMFSHYCENGAVYNVRYGHRLKGVRHRFMQDNVMWHNVKNMLVTSFRISEVLINGFRNSFNRQVNSDDLNNVYLYYANKYNLTLEQSQFIEMVNQEYYSRDDEHYRAADIVNAFTTLAKKEQGNFEKQELYSMIAGDYLMRLNK